MKWPWTYSALPARPFTRWPGGAQIALWIAVGVESYRPGDGRTEDVLPRESQPDLTNAAWREYGNRVGAFRLLDRLQTLGIRPTLLLNTDVYDEAPAVLDAARSVRAEVVAHGLSNSDALNDMTEEEERLTIETCTERIEANEGNRPLGWSSPWLVQRPTTLKHLRQAGYKYVLDFRLDDQPVWLNAGEGSLLAIPYATELNDSTTMIGRLASADEFGQMIRHEFEELSFSSNRQALVMSVVLHSFISGQPFRLQPIMRALEEIVANRQNVWLTTPCEIYQAVTEMPELASGDPHSRI